MTINGTSKYLIHAKVTADGVVERSDVVGAIFGQTEGLLGDDLDLHDLQQSSKVGRIDVEIESARGQSYGEITIASSMDKVETAVLGAALETIERVGPCRAEVEVTRIEDVRAAARREVVKRAQDLLATAFDDTVMSSEELLEEVRESVRVEDITDYEGYPAGPRVADSDAIILVEGRADVLTLLRYGIKNAVAVEGTNVPPEIADLTLERTVTAFLDGDRGGELIMKELEQVADVDAVAFAPAGRSVEDLDREEVMTALRRKVPYERIAGANAPRDLAPATDGSAQPAPSDTGTAEPEGAEAESVEAGDVPTTDEDESVPEADAASSEPAAPETLRGPVTEVIEDGSGEVRLLDAEHDVVTTAPAEEAFETIADAPARPWAVVLDGEVDQRLLDVAAQRGVEQVVARELGEFTKRPTSVRVRTAEAFTEPDVDVDAD